MNNNLPNLPAAGQETLEAWANAFRLQRLEQFNREFEASSPEEQEKLKALLQKCLGPIGLMLQDCSSESQKEENQTQDPIDFVFRLSGRHFIPLFQSVGADAGLPASAQGNFRNFLEATCYTTAPEIMRNAAHVFTPENIQNIDAYTNLRDIWSLMSGCMHQPLKDLLVNTDFRVSKDKGTTEEKEKEKEIDSTEEILDSALDEFFAPILEEDFEKIWDEMEADMQDQGNFSIASARGIAHPDTLEGLYQRLPEQPFLLTDGSKKELVVVPSPRLEEIANQAMAVTRPILEGATEADLVLVKEGVMQKFEDQMRMKCAVAGCQNLSEFEAKQKKLEELKEEAAKSTDPTILLQRDYEAIAVLVDNPLDQEELSSLFETFRTDKEAYHRFMKAHNRTHVNCLLNLIPAFQRTMLSMKHSDKSMQELLDPALISISMSQVMLEMRDHLNQESLKIEDEYEKKGHYFACKWLEKCGPSMIRLQLAKVHPNYKLAKEAKDFGLIDKMPKKQQIQLTEFDLKFERATRHFGANPTEDLPTLDLIKQVGSKTDEEMIAILMQHEEQQHRAFVEAFGMTVMPNLID